MSTLTAPRRPAKPARLEATLALAISHQVYAVTPIRGIQDPEVLKAFRLEKKSDPDAVYDVALTVHGLECTCPDFEARHRGLPTQGCKHVQALVGLGLLERPAAATPMGFIPPAAPAVEETPAVPQIPAEPVPAAPAVEPAAACCPADEPAPCVPCALAPAPADPAKPWLSAEDVAFRATVARVCATTAAEDHPAGPASWPAWTDEVWATDDEPTPCAAREAPPPPVNTASIPPAAPADSGPDSWGDWSDEELFETVYAPALLPLDEWIEAQAVMYSRMGTPAAALVAGAISALVTECRILGASNTTDFHDRKAAYSAGREALDADARNRPAH
jgi:hypothetical protein